MGKNTIDINTLTIDEVYFLWADTSSYSTVSESCKQRHMAILEIQPMFFETKNSDHNITDDVSTSSPFF